MVLHACHGCGGFSKRVRSNPHSSGDTVQLDNPDHPFTTPVALYGLWVASFIPSFAPYACVPPGPTSGKLKIPNGLAEHSDWPTNVDGWVRKIAWLAAWVLSKL